MAIVLKLGDPKPKRQEVRCTGEGNYPDKLTACGCIFSVGEEDLFYTLDSPWPDEKPGRKTTVECPQCGTKTGIIWSFNPSIASTLPSYTDWAANKPTVEYAEGIAPTPKASLGVQVSCTGERTGDLGCGYRFRVTQRNLAKLRMLGNGDYYHIAIYVCPYCGARSQLKKDGLEINRLPSYQEEK